MKNIKIFLFILLAFFVGNILSVNAEDIITGETTVNVNPKIAITMVKLGTGTGTVTSDDGKINCGGTCSAETYTLGSGVVAFQQVASPGSTFAGWGGDADCSNGMVTMDGNKNCTATFNLTSSPKSAPSVEVIEPATNITSTSARLSANVTSDGNDPPVSRSICYGLALNSTSCHSVGTGTGIYYYDTINTAPPLTPDTTYYFRGKAENDTGLTYSTNGTFKTLPTSTYLLTTAKAGTGSGTITSNPTGINCGADCTESYASGTSVTLTASPALDSSFSGWSGACTNTTGTCTVTMSAARNVTATFTKIPVINSITATSVVFGNASEIRIDVSDPYVCFVAVDFVNTPYQYSGRYIDRPIPILSSTSLSIGSHTASVMCTNNDGVASNGGSWTSTPFTVNSPGFGLTISKVGSGTVTSSDSLINCGADCFETYASGASVTLNAVASTGYTFTGWSGGGCSGTGACTTSMTTSKTITATFTANTYTLTYTTNTGGTITGTTPQTVSYGASGTAVTATPDASYTFTSWSDGVATATRTDTNVTANKSVTASFSTNTNLLTTAKAGTGSGTITSNPTGINCGADCTESYASGTSVTLTASPALDSSFSGWSGACTNTTGTCTVTMSAARNVTATFTKIPVINSITATSVAYGNASEVSFTSSYSAYCFMSLDLITSPYLWEGALGSKTVNTSTTLSSGTHTASAICINSDGVASNGGSWTTTTFTVGPSNLAPNAPTISIVEKKYFMGNLNFNIKGLDPDATDKIHYVVDWMDGSALETTGVVDPTVTPDTTLTVNHPWPTPGLKNIKAKTVDEGGLSSSWTDFSFTVSVRPPAATIKTFDSNKPYDRINLGESIILAWTSENAEYCEMTTNFDTSTNQISDINPNANANKTFTPPSTTIYTLICTGDGGSSAPWPLKVTVGPLKPVVTEF